MQTKHPNHTLLDHTSDLGIRIYGTDLVNLFENAGNSLTELLLNTKKITGTTPLQIEIHGEDLEDLMVRWLGEILYLFEGENTVVTASKISRITERHLKATLETVKFDPVIHEVLMEIKAVTYHNIQVTEKNCTWEATVIFDL